MKKIIALVLAVLCVASLFSGCSFLGKGKYKKEAMSAAESYAISQFRKESGLTADKVECEVIYNEKNYRDNVDTLVVAVCYLEGTPVLSYCVWCQDGYVINSTTSKSGGYDYEKSLEDIKALFGIVDK